MAIRNREVDVKLESPRSRYRTVVGQVLISTVLLFGLTGCSGTGAKATSTEVTTNSPSVQPSTGTKSTPAAVPTVAKDASNGLHSIGQVSIKSAGVEVTSAVSVFAPTTEAAWRPNDTILNSCMEGLVSRAPTAGWIHGEMTITYKAAIAEFVQIPDTQGLGDLGGSGGDGVILFIDPSSGDCQTQKWSRMMNPNSSLKLEFWVFFEGLRTNAHPNFDVTYSKSLFWQYGAFGADQIFTQDVSTNPVITFSGNGAAKCLGPYLDGHNGVLLLYSKPPITVPVKLVGGSVSSTTCSRL